MKKLLLLLIIPIFFAQSKAVLNGSPIANSEQEYYYTSNVEHLFTHCLIAYPEIAFEKNNSMGRYYDADCITPEEFKQVLISLYENNYVLVNLYDCFKLDNGVPVKNKVKVPVGKKPIVLSFDDVNYDHKKQGRGMVDKIILDESGNIATVTNITGKSEIRYDNEFLPLLESFISAHPSFSPFGAKGTLNLTGYDGILGYRTSHTNKNNLTEEISEAKKVVKKLKELGWNFACHSYGHYHMKHISVEKFKDELISWQNEVEPLIGKTQVYVYPYGEWEVFEDGDFSPKHQLLVDYGFELFCGVGMKTFYSYLPSKSEKRVLFMDRKVIDGTTLRGDNKYLKDFFNPLLILDSRRPDYNAS